MTVCILTHFLDFMTETNTNICCVCPVDVELFKWCDYLGQYVFSAFLFAFWCGVSRTTFPPIQLFVLTAWYLKSWKTFYPSVVITFKLNVEPSREVWFNSQLRTNQYFKTEILIAKLLNLVLHVIQYECMCVFQLSVLGRSWRSCAGSGVVWSWVYPPDRPAWLCSLSGSDRWSTAPSRGQTAVSAGQSHNSGNNDPMSPSFLI